MKYNIIEFSSLFTQSAECPIGFDNNYGSIDDLKELIDECHKNNIKVLFNVDHCYILDNDNIQSDYYNIIDEYKYYNYENKDVIILQLIQLFNILLKYNNDGFVFRNTSQLMYILSYL